MYFKVIQQRTAKRRAQVADQLHVLIQTHESIKKGRVLIILVKMINKI